jgi:hypothetical protein
MAQTPAQSHSVGEVVTVGPINVEDGLIKATKEVRDGAAHVSENLVSSYDDVTRLANVKRECLRALGTSW